jgi:hypothetical protein
LERRNVAGEAGYRSTGALLSQLLNLTRRHAKARVEAAAHFGPRVRPVDRAVDPGVLRVVGNDPGTAGPERPDTGHGPDDRGEPERLHDALEDAAKRLLCTGELPTTAGVATTLIITLTLDQLETRAGQATTIHGGTLSIDEALRLAAAGKALPVVLGDGGGIAAAASANTLSNVRHYVDTPENTGRPEPPTIG